MTENTVDPSGKLDGLIYKWDIAAVNLPIPAKLVDDQNARQWGRYIACLRPAQIVEKFGEALDVFHSLLGQADNLYRIAPADGIRLYSAWEATGILAVEVCQRLQFADEAVSAGKIRSDVDIALHYIIDFMKSAHSADLQQWEWRRSQQAGIYDKAFLDFMNRAATEYKEKPAAPAP